MMVHTKALYRDLVGRDKKVNIPEATAWSVPERENPWKSSEPYTELEFVDYLDKGIAVHRLRGFEPVQFSKELVPATPLQLSQIEAESFSVTGRGVQTFYTWISEAPATIELRITGGLIVHYRNRGNAKVDLWKIQGPSDGAQDEMIVAHGESAPDGVERSITLQTRNTGLHKITVSDGDDMTKVMWNQNTPMTIVSSLDRPASISGSWSLYFYVPRKTEIVGLYAEGSGTLLDGAGNTVFTFVGKKAGFHSIEVPSGQDGRLWKFHKNTGVKRLVTVPSSLAIDASGLLLPREAVEADSD